MNSDPQKRPRILQRVRNWIHYHHTATLALGGLGLIIIASLVTVALLYQKPVHVDFTPTPIAKKEPKKPEYFSPLTGNKVNSEADKKLPVTAVMLENSPSARPQSGIKEAGVVYEAIAEAGITRFLAFYQQEKPQLVGPVRSLRMYYVDWLAPYNASIAHVGGSAAALQEVRSSNYRDIDQFFNGSYYWRATDRYAPHNVYTSFEKLDALNKAKGFTSSNFTGLSRKTSQASTKPSATSITVNFGSPQFNTGYAYNKTTNRYKRSLAGAPHNDREKGQVTPRVVVAMWVDEKPTFEDGYRESITTTGSGKATIFQNGGVKNVTWHKKDRGSNITFTDTNGDDVALARGQTWIAAVPNNYGEVSWQ